MVNVLGDKSNPKPFLKRGRNWPCIIAEAGCAREYNKELQLEERHAYSWRRKLVQSLAAPVSKGSSSATKDN